MAQPPFQGAPFFSDQNPGGGPPALRPTASPYITDAGWVPAASTPGIQIPSTPADLRLDYFQGANLYNPEQLGTDYAGLGPSVASGSVLSGSALRGSSETRAPTAYERQREVAAERATKIKEKNRWS